jgi:hypothetical protein
MPKSYAFSSNSPAFLLLGITIVLFVCFSGCKRESIQENGYDDYLCTDAACVTYQSIWADLLRDRNSMSQAWFDSHITPKVTAVSPMSGGLSKFSIHYELTIDWATWHGYDEFVVSIDSVLAPTPSVWVPKNVSLSAAEVASLIDADYGGYISKICAVDHLAFDSDDDAIAYMHRKSIRHLTSFRLVGAGQGLPCQYLTARPSRNRMDVDCNYATLDLISKDFQFYKVDCPTR